MAVVCCVWRAKRSGGPGTLEARQSEFCEVYFGLAGPEPYQGYGGDSAVLPVGYFAFAGRSQLPIFAELQ